jgi:hypothetical protein
MSILFYICEFRPKRFHKIDSSKKKAAKKSAFEQLADLDDDDEAGSDAEVDVEEEKETEDKKEKKKKSKKGKKKGDDDDDLDQVRLLSKL